MSSAPTGTRMVARALPGSGGSAARALASAACFAAWRAAHGAAPRNPSLRLSGGVLSLVPPPLAPGPAARPAPEDFGASSALGLEPFFVLAMSVYALVAH